MSDSSATIEFICRNSSRLKLVAHKDCSTESNTIRKKVVEESLGYKRSRDAEKGASLWKIDLSWRPDGSDKGCSDHCAFIIEDDPLHDIVLGRLACAELNELKERGLYPLGSPAPITDGQASVSSR